MSNDPSQLRPGDILLSEGVTHDVVLRVTCHDDRRRGELEVLTASHPILVEDVPVKDRAILGEDATITIEKGLFLRCHFGDGIIEEERNVINRLEIADVSHSYDQKETALDGITMTARRGEMICVMGPSGCGKSTLLRVLSGHLNPSQGQVGLNSTLSINTTRSSLPIFVTSPKRTPSIRSSPFRRTSISPPRSVHPISAGASGDDAWTPSSWSWD